MSGRWPCSVVDQVMLESMVERFLRTHRDGWARLAAWMESVAPDRTEEERAREAKAHEAAVHAVLSRVNAERAVQGLGPINRRGEIVSGRGAPRNRKALEASRAERAQIAELLSRKPTLPPKAVLRILGWPSGKLRTVQRHVRAIRK